MNVEEIHQFRKEIDALIFKATKDMNEEKIRERSRPGYSREMSLVRTKLQEAKMWAGKCLEELGEPFPKELRDEAVTGEAE